VTNARCARRARRAKSARCTGVSALRFVVFFVRDDFDEDFDDFDEDDFADDFFALVDDVCPGAAGDATARTAAQKMTRPRDFDFTAVTYILRENGCCRMVEKLVHATQIENFFGGARLQPCHSGAPALAAEVTGRS
jgi:hypothetical protein